MLEVYHESQSAALCGLHALNSLLQGPFFTEIDLAGIAQELDRQERALLGQVLRDQHGEGNVREDGMFSSQVLFRALENVGLEAIPSTNPTVRAAMDDPAAESAFILNLHDHWFSLRRLDDGSWWDLNSMSPAPEPIGEFYLSAFLQAMRQGGYTVFVIRGSIEATRQLLVPSGVNNRGGGRWWSPEEARSRIKQKEDVKRRGQQQHLVDNLMEMAAAGARITSRAAAAGAAGAARALGAVGAGASAALGVLGGGGASTEEEDLRRAMEASLQGQGGAGRGGGGPGGLDEEAELQRAIAASLGGGAGPAAAAAAPWMSSDGAGPSVSEPYNPDLEYERAIAASLREYRGGAREEGWEVVDGAGPSAHPPPPPPSPNVAPPGPLTVISGVTSSAAAVPDSRSSPAVTSRPSPSPAPSGPPTEPPEGAPGSITLALRVLGKGAVRLQRRFLLSDTVGGVLAFVRSQGTEGVTKLSTAYPRRVLADPSLTLGAAGVSDKEALTAE